MAFVLLLLDIPGGDSLTACLSLPNVRQLLCSSGTGIVMCPAIALFVLSQYHKLPYLFCQSYHQCIGGNC
jgi:hypothetical protein